MTTIGTIFALIVGGVLLVPVADRLHLPHPVLVTGWGMVWALLPGATDVHLDPETLLGLVLPPLLYAGAQRTSWREFTAHKLPILLLAVVLVILTAAAVAGAAASIHPALPLAAAVVLGSLVSPPDAAAATSVSARLGLPRRLVTILEGEGLFNDVTALTLYQVTVYSAVHGSLSLPATLGRLAFSTVLALAAGLGIGWITGQLLDRLPTASARAGLSLLAPFAAYLPVAAAHGSGVLAVLATALYLSHTRAYTDDATSRVTGRAFWSVIELLVICATFGLVGLELISVIRAVGHQAGRLVGYAGLICLIVIVVRVLWLPPLAALARRRARPRPVGEQVPASWRDSLVLSWAGMRGVITIATALALPRLTAANTPFPGRDQIIFVAVTVVLVTLIVQGTSLPWLITWLHLRVDPAAQSAADRHAATIALDAAEARLRERRHQLDTETADLAAQSFYAALADAFPEDEDVSDPEQIQHHKQVRALEIDLLHAAREAVVDARNHHIIAPDAADRLIHRLDLRSLTAS